MQNLSENTFPNENNVFTLECNATIHFFFTPDITDEKNLQTMKTTFVINMQEFYKKQLQIFKI